MLLFVLLKVSIISGRKGNVVIMFPFHGSFASLRPSSLVGNLSCVKYIGVVYLV